MIYDISNKYHAVNINWLLTGKGVMCGKKVGSGRNNIAVTPAGSPCLGQ